LSERPKRFQDYPLLRFYEEIWFYEMTSYLKLRFASITQRLFQTFRFVDLYPINKDTFSYEYASLLRDIGSVFSSVMDKLLRGALGEKQNSDYNIDDFRRFLLSEIEDIENVKVSLNVSYLNSNLFPYEGLSGKRHSLRWWKAFTNIKHSDILCINEGCLSNVIHAFGALTILYDCLIEPHPFYWMEHTEGIISRIFSVDSEQKEQYHRFPEAKYPVVDESSDECK